jgi:HEAT repeat protein
LITLLPWLKISNASSSCSASWFSVSFHHPWAAISENQELTFALADTEKVNQAAGLLSEEFANPEALLILLKILTTESKPQDIRQLAGVEARKRIEHVWPNVESGIKPNIRAKILEFAISDPTKLLRHSAAQIIAEMATHDLENQEWTDLPGKLLQASNSPEALHREMGLYIMLSLIMTAPDLFMSDVDAVVAVLKDKIQDPESAEVRLNALAIFAAIAPVIDVDDNPDAVATIQSCVPSMVAVLKAAIDSGEDDTSMKAFEAFQEILEGSPAFFQKHFADLIRFMIQIMANTEADPDLRLAAVNFLAEAVTLRKMKIQSMKLGEEIAMSALKVVVEMDDFDDEGEKNPSNQCLALIDLLAANLPPTQVVLPLLKAVGAYAIDSNPSVRRAGILALSMCVEGAPDFFSTQLKEITPLVLQLLADPETIVRGAALKAVARLADDIREDFGVLHETIIPGIIKNFDIAVQSIPTSTGKAQEDFTQIILDCCIAIDSMMDGMKEEDTAKYIDELVPRFSRLLQEDNFKMKICALSATGAIAESAGEGFLPYFKDAVHGLGVYLEAKESTEDLELRRATTEAMGKIATAVGPIAFKDYVQPLMTASEEGLHLDNSGLKEQSYILWSQLAKVYKEDFDHFLEGVVKGLLECMEQEEAMMMGEDAEDKIAKILATMEQTKGRSAKDPDVLSAIDKLLDGGEGEEGIMIDDLDDFEGSAASGIAMEKEIALEAMGDVISHTKAKFLPYFPQTIESIMKLVDHAWPGVVQSSMGTLWRAYGTLWEIETERGMEKWKAGIPLKVQPSSDLTKLGDAVMQATLTAWAQQDDRYVILSSIHIHIEMMKNDVRYTQLTQTQCGC